MPRPQGERGGGGRFQPHPTTTKSENSFLAFVSRGKRPQIHEKVVSKAREGGRRFQPHPNTTKSENSFLEFVSRRTRPQTHVLIPNSMYKKVVPKAREGEGGSNPTQKLLNLVVVLHLFLEEQGLRLMF